MKTYYISVTETLNKIVEVQAESSEEALRKVEDAYDADEFELDHNDMEDLEFEDDTDRLLESYDNGTIGFRADDGSGLAFTKKEVSFIKLDDFPDEF